VRFVVAPGSLVVTDVSGVLRRIRAPGRALALAALVETFLVTARVLARVRQTVDATGRRLSLDITQVPRTHTATRSVP